MSRAAPFSLRQQELLEHALAIVRDGGLAALTVRRLAESVGFSEAALYRHFASKHALLAALLDHLAEERLLGPMRRIVERIEVPAAERITQLLAHHVRLVVAIDGLPILLLAEAASSEAPDVIARIRYVAASELELLEGLIAELPPDPRRPPARELARLLFGLPAAAAVLRRLIPDAGVEERVGGPLAEYFVGRLLGRAPGRDDEEDAR